MNRKIIFEDLGRIDYQEAWDLQERLLKQTVATKTWNRSHPDSTQPTENRLLFVEHPHVYTLGKSGDKANLLLDDDQLKERSISYYKINRGGDITYHGPGQIVGYPIFDLSNFKEDIHLYLRNLEEAAILTLADYGLVGERMPGFTGVWMDKDNENARKILAIGVRCSRWVTMHGFAFNVNTDLSLFKNIIPCGIDDKDVTSLQRELGRKMNMQEVKDKLLGHLAQVFGFEIEG